MNAIPGDMMDSVASIMETLDKRPHNYDIGKALEIAILAERQRCADVARRYLEDIAGCNMNEDEPEKIAAAVMDQNWEPPLL